MISAGAAVTGELLRHADGEHVAAAAYGGKTRAPVGGGAAVAALAEQLLKADHRSRAQPQPRPAVVWCLLRKKRGAEYCAENEKHSELHAVPSQQQLLLLAACQPGQEAAEATSPLAMKTSRLQPERIECARDETAPPVGMMDSFH